MGKGGVFFQSSSVYLNSFFPPLKQCAGILILETSTSARPLLSVHDCARQCSPRPCVREKGRKRGQEVHGFAKLNSIYLSHDDCHPIAMVLLPYDQTIDISPLEPEPTAFLWLEELDDDRKL